LLDNMLSLMCKLGWMEYIGMRCTSYDCLTIEFLSSSNVNRDGKFRDQEVDITFYMSNIEH